MLNTFDFNSRLKKKKRLPFDILPSPKLKHRKKTRTKVSARKTKKRQRLVLTLTQAYQKSLNLPIPPPIHNTRPNDDTNRSTKPKPPSHKNIPSLSSTASISRFTSPVLWIINQLFSLPCHSALRRRNS